MAKGLFSSWLGNYFATFYASILFSVVAALIPASGLTQVVATAPYSVTTFATAPSGLSAPDSVTFSATNVFVGYGNGGAPDGSGGAKSNVVEYDFKGNTITTFDIVGHNDGLRYNPRTNTLWALQNEDGNANLSIISLRNGSQEIFQLGTGPHGGGYDDIDFNFNTVYLSASAPTINPNTAPAIVTFQNSRKGPVLTGILNGNATVTNVTTGTRETLNLQDPDSMILNSLGELVMTSQGDGELIIVQHPGLSCQNALVVPLTSAAGGSTIGNTQLDDTVFTNQSSGELLVADKQLNTVFAITAPYFGPSAYSAVSVFSTPTAASPIESFVGQTNLTTGFVTPIVTGMGNPGGMAFIPSGVNLAKYVAASAAIPESCP
ncbi:MAG: hypothetical protein JO121_02285 [Deltaproteobacteria bacterium]|nr:hypothetical protein [Deltaproteobacteria bacterium]